MKKYIITIVMAVLTCTISFGQDKQILNIHIKAKWTNTYGSKLNIKEFNEASGYFTGTYTSPSATRKTDICRVIGFVGKKDDYKQSAPISIAVNHKDIETTTGDSTEKMTSTLTGQLFVDNISGEIIMELYQNLQNPVDNVKSDPDFQHAGNYGQTLTFTIEGEPVDNPEWKPSPIVETPYTGVWDIINEGKEGHVNIVAISQDHVVQATYTDTDGTHQLKGFIGDYQTSSEPKSIALAGYNHANNKVMGITGMIGETPAIEDSSFDMDEISISVAPKLAPIEITIKDEEGEIIYKENHPEDQPSKTIKVDVKPVVTHTIGVKHTESWGFWDMLFNWFWGHKDTFSVNAGDETLLSGIIGLQPNIQSFISEKRTNSMTTTGDLVFDALLITGQSTYIKPNETPACQTHYSATKIDGIYMTGPKENKASIASFELDQFKNPLANYGATQWTSNIAVGTKKGGGDILKFGVDTGGNFNWANSTQCETASCTDDIHNQFNPATSPTFEWINQKRDSVSWGPWGKGVANTGRDVLKFLDNEQNPKTDFKLITSFPDNNQFKYFWDGALAMPSNNIKMVDSLSMFLARMMSTGALKIQKEFPVSFVINDENGDLPFGEKGGKIQFGIEDETLYNPDSKVVMPFKKYLIGGSSDAVSYLWTTDLTRFDMGGTSFGQTLTRFCFDSGSSAIKGDAITMAKALDYANYAKHTYNEYPEMNIQMGTLSKTGELATFKLTHKEYVKKIERGDSIGKYVPQIQTLDGVDELLVQGSTLMDHIYTVFVYLMRINPNILDIEMYAKEIRAYNKKGGPEIIQIAQTSKSKVADVAATLESSGVTVYPNPLPKYLSIRLTSETEEEIQIVFRDLAGRMIYKTSRKARIGANLFNLKNSITDPRSIQQKMLILSISNESGTIDFKEKLLLE